MIVSGEYVSSVKCSYPCPMKTAPSSLWCPAFPPHPPWRCGGPKGSPPAFSCNSTAGLCGDCGGTDAVSFACRTAASPAGVTTRHLRVSDRLPDRPEFDIRNADQTIRHEVIEDRFSFYFRCVSAAVRNNRLSDDRHGIAVADPVWTGSTVGPRSKSLQAHRQSNPWGKPAPEVPG